MSNPQRKAALIHECQSPFERPMFGASQSIPLWNCSTVIVITIFVISKPRTHWSCCVVSIGKRHEQAWVTSLKTKVCSWSGSSERLGHTPCTRKNPSLFTFFRFHRFSFHCFGFHHLGHLLSSPSQDRRMEVSSCTGFVRSASISALNRDSESIFRTFLARVALTLTVLTAIK